ncbi:MAG: hypothetical protein Kow00133_15900 [Amphiplicatus sp.]
MPITTPAGQDGRLHPDSLLTIPEAAERLRCSRATVYALVRRGHLDLRKLGSATRITARSLLRLIAEGAPRVRGGGR